MEHNRRYFSGHTLQQALMRAASHYGCTPEELAWKEVEKRHGFLKVRRGVIVEVDPEAPRRERGAETPAPSRPPTPVAAPPSPPAREETPREVPAPQAPAATGGETPEQGADRPWWAMPPAPGQGEAEPETPSSFPARAANGDEEAARPRARGGRSRRGRRGGGGGRGGGAATERPSAEITALREAPASPGERWSKAEGEVAECARRWTQQLLDLAGLELAIDVFDAGEELLVELGGRHRELVVADRGRVLLAIQHLLPRLMRADLGETPELRVDSEGFHDLREETLRDLAQRAAERVRENRRPWLLEPMAPDERRIVHLTLADDPAVTTESLGEGYFKRVRVQPERSRGR